MRKELEGYEAVQFGVFGFVDCAHTAAADSFDDLIMGNSFTDQLYLL